MRRLHRRGRSRILLFLTCCLAAGAALSAPGGAAATGGAVRDLTLPKQAQLRAGAVTLLVSNPNGFPAKGSLELRLGKRHLAQTSMAVPAHGGRKVAVRLGRSARAALTKLTAPRLSAIASFRDPGGHPHRTTSTIVASRTGGSAPSSPNQPKGPAAPATEPDVGPDGVYHGSDGLTVIIAAGKVTSFNGQITTYCTRSERQKTVAFGMFGDDPAPTVGADGSFACEATTGYGFVKLKYEGTVSGDSAGGKLVVEDRSPMSTSDGRLDFDYCFAGADWAATR